MSGRDRVEIGTHGDINTPRTTSGILRAEARYRDGDGTVPKVTATTATIWHAMEMDVPQPDIGADILAGRE